MPYLIIAIIFIIILSVIFSSFMPKIKTKKAYDELLSYLKQTDLNYSIEKIKNDIFDAKLNINSTHYYIKFLNIPAYSEIQINNKTTNLVGMICGQSDSSFATETVSSKILSHYSFFLIQ